MQLVLAVIIFNSLANFSLGFGSIPRSSCSTSPLFIGLANRNINSRIHLSKDSDAQNAEIIGKNSESNDAIDERTVFQKVDAFGSNLKARAAATNMKAQSVVGNGTEKILLTVKSCSLYSAFILYRAYRGFFVILPAVFQQVYRKMNDSLNDPFLDDSETAEVGVVRTKTKAPVRTAIIVSFVSFMVTLSYAITGAYKVLAMFVSTMTRTSKVEPAFEAAADEILTNENKILKMANEKISVNGEELAP